MSVDETNYVLLKKMYYGIEVIFYVKQYRNFELTNITRIIRISTIVYTPSVKHLWLVFVYGVIGDNYLFPSVVDSNVFTFCLD